MHSLLETDEFGRSNQGSPIVLEAIVQVGYSKYVHGVDPDRIEYLHLYKYDRTNTLTLS